MSSVVRGGPSVLPDGDIHAVAIYYADLSQGTARHIGNSTDINRRIKTSDMGIGQVNDVDERLYVAACAACRYSSGADSTARHPDLALNSALRLDQPTNLIQVVLHGVGGTEGDSALMMPGFADALSDTDIARLVVYLRRTQTGLPPWAEVESQVATIRKARADAP
jgi:cytochrome c553